MFRATLLSLSIMFSAAAYAQPYTLYTSITDRQAKGGAVAEQVFIDLVEAMFKQADISVQTRQAQWLKAQMGVRNANPDEKLLIAPLSRTQEREESYDWVVPLLAFNLNFLTTDKSIDLSDLESLKSQQICAWRESPAEYKLKSMQFPEIISKVNVQKCYDGLRKGKIKVMLAHGKNIASVLYTKAKGNLDDLNFGQAFGDYTVYLAATKGAISEATQKSLSDALDALKIDGTYASILKQYGIQ